MYAKSQVTPYATFEKIHGVVFHARVVPRSEFQTGANVGHDLVQVAPKIRLHARRQGPQTSIFLIEISSIVLPPARWHPGLARNDQLGAYDRAGCGPWMRPPIATNFA